MAVLAAPAPYNGHAAQQARVRDVMDAVFLARLAEDHLHDLEGEFFASADEREASLAQARREVEWANRQARMAVRSEGY